MKSLTQKDRRFQSRKEPMWRKLATLTAFLLIPVVAPVLTACGGSGAPEESAAAAPAASARPAAVRQSSAPAAAPAPAAPAARPAHKGFPQKSGEEPLVVFLGDSLTAGLGLGEAAAYPARVEAALEGTGEPVRVLNAGVSGDTTAGGLARLGWTLKQKPDVLVVGLGANDGLRGLPLDDIEKNLRQILSRGQAAGARVLLLGMRLPPNYGEYADRFAAMYPRIARDMNVTLVPFLLEGVGGVARLNQADGIHPTAEGQEILARNVVPYLRSVLAQEETRAAAGAS
jgi:acyl-CoA thioesterase-1